MPNAENRKRMGAYVAALRQAKGWTQSDLATCLGFKRYNFISQVENGQGSVPPQRLKAFALALDVDPAEFAWEWLRNYQPHVWRILSKPKKRAGL